MPASVESNFSTLMSSLARPVAAAMTRAVIRPRGLDCEVSIARSRSGCIRSMDSSEEHSGDQREHVV
jgi:hypothetical protein